MVLIRFKANSVATAHATYHLPPLETLLSDWLSLFLCAKFNYMGFSHWFIPGKCFPPQDLKASRVKRFSKKRGIATFISLGPEVWKEFGRTLTFAWTKGEKKKCVSLVTFFCKQGFEARTQIMQGRLFVDPLSFKKLPQLGCHCLTLLSLHFHSNRNIWEISIAF